MVHFLLPGAMQVNKPYPQSLAESPEKKKKKVDMSAVWSKVAQFAGAHIDSHQTSNTHTTELYQHLHLKILNLLLVANASLIYPLDPRSPTFI